MTPEDIERMAREAGFDAAPDGHIYPGPSSGFEPITDELTRFAALVRAQALAEAAQTAEAAGIAACDSYGDGAECIETGERCAAAIRALAGQP